MSYDLRIWEIPADQPQPALFEEAARFVFALEGQEAGAHPKFKALAEQMAAYKGCGEAPWVGDPVAEAQRCSRRVWVISLPADNRMQLLYTVVRLANALGLSVLDDQLGLALLAPKNVLPPQRASVWREIVLGVQAAGPATPVDGPTMDWAQGTMRAELTALLAPLDFISPRQPLDLPYYRVQTLANYFRSTPAGGQVLTLASSILNNEPCITIDVNVFSGEIADVLRAVFPEHDEMYFRRQLNFYVGIFRGIFAYAPIRSHADLYGMVEEMREPVLGILETSRTSVGMESIMSGKAAFTLPRSPNSLVPTTLAMHAQQNYGYAALISAWLYGGDDFAALAQAKRDSEERNVFEPMKAEMVERVDRLVAYLRAQVPRKGAQA